MGTWGIIIVIIFSLWGVISQVLEAAAKKAKEKKRIEEAELRAARQLDLTVSAPAESGTTFQQRSAGQSPPIPGMSQPRASMSSIPEAQSRSAIGAKDLDLAARRKAQLEQLKQRRQVAIDPLTGSVQIRTSGPGQGQAARGSAGAGGLTPPVAPGTTPGRAAKRLGKKQKPQQPFRATHQPPPPAAPQRAAPRVSSRPEVAAPQAPSRFHQAPPAVARGQGAEAPDAYATVAPRSDAFSRGRAESEFNSAGLMGLLQQPANLRLALVLKEVLDPPVALRDDVDTGYVG